MDVSAELDAPCDPPLLFAWVDDLERYPQWLSIVPRAERDADDDNAWRIDLRGRMGPLSRSKRLRMVRTRHDAPTSAVFERDERDGQEHSVWRLQVEVVPIEDGSRLVMRLHYGGRLWEPLVERLLRDEIESSKARLLALIAAEA
jgi:polyketide cyclase/dehydrase/lipid transport protein